MQFNEKSREIVDQPHFACRRRNPRRTLSIPSGTELLPRFVYAERLWALTDATPVAVAKASSRRDRLEPASLHRRSTRAKRPPPDRARRNTCQTPRSGRRIASKHIRPRRTRMKFALIAALALAASPAAFAKAKR